MNIKEFRNNFCKLAEGTQVISVTKRNEVVGVYTPKNSSKLMCERSLFNETPCERQATVKVEVTYQDNKIVGNLCEICYAMLKNTRDDSFNIKVIKEKNDNL